MSDLLIKGSILGDREKDFSDQEKVWIHQISIGLRARHGNAYQNHHTVDDMDLFSRIAAGVYEMAKMTKAMAVNSRKPVARERGFDEWLFIVTGINFNLHGDNLETTDTTWRIYGQEKEERPLLGKEEEGGFIDV